MISGDTAKLAAYKKQLPETVYAALEAVAVFDFGQPDGKYEMDGMGILSVESPETEPASARKLEGHKKFIDVVYLADGEEWIGVQPKTGRETETEAYPERDLYFFDGSAEETRVHMKPGYFLVCWPEDLHRPLCEAAGGAAVIRKAVLKLAAD